MTCELTNEDANVKPDQKRIPVVMIHLRLKRSPRYPNNGEKTMKLMMKDDCSIPACELSIE